ncbi:Cytochrome P450 [Corchorus capsularis]|uniref:Cytochrome P450 n=1 Tax=Corchorus capsularis TaxID=210143 RepID=A0A1R3I3S4_COCAP|nr:Cytochrome P450 [Corchorus capsularis]
MWGGAILICVVALLLLRKFSRWLHNWYNPKCNGQLPPGSMGLPFIGETIEFFTPHSLNDIPPFISKRMQRYGAVFRTSLVGQKVIVSTDPEINYEIFQQENKSFLLSYTESFLEIFGQESLVKHHGMLHKYLKNLVLHLVSPENLKGSLLAEMDKATRKHLNSWAILGTMDVKEGSSEMILEYFAKKLIDYDEMNTSPNKKLIHNFHAFMDGLISFPLNIPGFAYHACLQKEHEAIIKTRDYKDSQLTWKEYKSMTFTHMVINETVRLANIVPGIFRKALTDVEMKGYTIPAGWSVMVVPAAVHLSPGKYDDPLQFNPWRWEGKELHLGSKTFMAFGGGIRLCVGADFAKLQMAIFIHHMVTKYRWRVIKGGDIVRKPGLMFPNGLHIKIYEK